MTGRDAHQIAARELLAAFRKDVIDHRPGPAGRTRTVSA